MAGGSRNDTFFNGVVEMRLTQMKYSLCFIPQIYKSVEENKVNISSVKFNLPLVEPFPLSETHNP
jgi:hypothetical protein